ncbi:cupin domain-containing protein [Microtetraspora fusca]|uniref:Cupin domain-containing protein n=1 Tax=Microtetraspora fusca TaxID=1997 RepID=A0ABW6VFB7_MICFU
MVGFGLGAVELPLGDHVADHARANMVRFAPGARTAWHSHGLGQTLYIVEGVALIQARGGQLIEAHPGDIVHTPPGEEHWHGAAPDRFMVHLAMWESDETTWLEHVSDAEYGTARRQAPGVPSCSGTPSCRWTAAR